MPRSKPSEKAGSIVPAERAVDWNYDGTTFKSQWQAIRGNGKKASIVPTTVTQPLAAASKRTIAVRVVDVFGNDAAGMLSL